MTGQADRSLRNRHALVTGGATGIAPAAPFHKTTIDQWTDVMAVNLTGTLALELALTGITANCVCPGFTDTAQQRLISPEEIANVVVWLCQDSSRSINGQAIAVAGGEIM